MLGGEGADCAGGRVRGVAGGGGGVVGVEGRGERGAGVGGWDGGGGDVVGEWAAAAWEGVEVYVEVHTGAVAV